MADMTITNAGGIPQSARSAPSASRAVPVPRDEGKGYPIGLAVGAGVPVLAGLIGSVLTRSGGPLFLGATLGIMGGIIGAAIGSSITDRTKESSQYVDTYVHDLIGRYDREPRDLKLEIGTEHRRDNPHRPQTTSPRYLTVRPLLAEAGQYDLDGDPKVATFDEIKQLVSRYDKVDASGSGPADGLLQYEEERSFERDYIFETSSRDQ